MGGSASSTSGQAQGSGGNDQARRYWMDAMDALFPGVGVLYGGARLLDRAIPDHMQRSDDEIRNDMIQASINDFFNQGYGTGDFGGAGMGGWNGGSWDIGSGGSPGGVSQAEDWWNGAVTADELPFGVSPPAGTPGGPAASAGEGTATTFQRWLASRNQGGGGGGGGGGQPFTPVSILGANSPTDYRYSSGVPARAGIGTRPPLQLSGGKGGK